MSATIPSPPNNTTLSLSTCFSNDHYAVTGSPSLELYAFRFVTAEKINSTAGSLNSATLC